MQCVGWKIENEETGNEQGKMEDEKNLVRGEWTGERCRYVWIHKREEWKPLCIYVGVGIKEGVGVG